jgi:hypothetical protein
MCRTATSTGELVSLAATKEANRVFTPTLGGVYVENQRRGSKKREGCVVRRFERAWFWNGRRGEHYEFPGGASEMT